MPGEGFGDGIAKRVAGALISKLFQPSVEYKHSDQ